MKISKFKKETRLHRIGKKGEVHPVTYHEGTEGE
jgi:hypothetical protein